MQRGTLEKCTHKNLTVLRRPLAFSARRRLKLFTPNCCKTNSRTHRATQPVSITEGNAASTGNWDRDDWYSAYQNVEEAPDGYWLKPEGVLPADLKGTYFRNGPGLLEFGGEEVKHPYDSNGLVCSISFKNGRAFYRSRHVETKESLIEREQGKRLFKGVFGTTPKSTLARPLDVHVKNTGNTSVLLWGSKLWTLFESGQPYMLDPYRLRTCGMDNLNGRFKEGLPFDSGLGDIANDVTGTFLRLLKSSGLEGPLETPVGGDAVCAHPKIDPVTDRLVLFSYKLKASQKGGMLSTELTFYELDKRFNLVSKKRYTVEAYAFIHDFALTPNYYVIVQNPVTFDLLRYLSGDACPIHCVQWDASKPSSKVHIIPRGSNTTQSPFTSGYIPENYEHETNVQCIEVAPSFTFHHANAYEDGNTIVLDSIHYPRFPDFTYMLSPGKEFKDIDPDQQPIGRLRRLTLDLEKGTGVVGEMNFRAVEFPNINPGFTGSRYNYAYMAASLHPHKNQPPQAISKVNVHTGHVELWSKGSRYYVGEPQFVPRYAGLGPVEEVEDDGWLLCLCYDASNGRSELVVLDARDITKGPVAVLPLKGRLPHGLHGTWSEKYFGP